MTQGSSSPSRQMEWLNKIVQGRILEKDDSSISVDIFDFGFGWANATPSDRRDYVWPQFGEPSRVSGRGRWGSSSPLPAPAVPTCRPAGARWAGTQRREPGIGAPTERL